MDLSRVADHQPVAVDDEEREAAVLVPILTRDDASLLLTKRADHLGEHPGQTEFPRRWARARRF